jgi:hypothetical protein
MDIKAESGSHNLLHCILRNFSLFYHNGFKSSEPELHGRLVGRELLICVMFLDFQKAPKAQASYSGDFVALRRGLGTILYN